MCRLFQHGAAYSFSSDVYVGEARTIRTGTQHFGELPYVYSVALEAFESSGILPATVYAMSESEERCWSAGVASSGRRRQVNEETSTVSS